MRAGRDLAAVQRKLKLHHMRWQDSGRSMYYLTQGTTGKVHPKCSLHWPCCWAFDVPLRRLEPAATAASLKLTVRHSNGQAVPRSKDGVVELDFHSVSAGWRSGERANKGDRDALTLTRQTKIGVWNWSQRVIESSSQDLSSRIPAPIETTVPTFFHHPTRSRSSFKRPPSRPARAGRSH